jgi:hypothetical protein
VACRERPSGGRVAFDPVRGIAPAGNALGRSGIPGRGAGGVALGAASPLRDGATAIGIVGTRPHAGPAQYQEQSGKQRPHARSIGPSAELLYAPVRVAVATRPSGSGESERSSAPARDEPWR